MSRAVRIVIFPESMVSMMSFVSLSRAVSVEWNLRYADCKGQKLGDTDMWGKRRARARRSSILPIVFKFEIGIELTSFLWHMPADTTETVAEHSARLQPSINLHAPYSCQSRQYRKLLVDFTSGNAQIFRWKNLFIVCITVDSQLDNLGNMLAWMSAIRERKKVTQRHFLCQSKF